MKNSQRNFSEKDILQTGKFLAGIAAFFLFFWFLFSALPLEWFEYFYAFFSLEFLKIIGFIGYLGNGEPIQIFLENFPGVIEISFLCTGLLELWIVWSAVLASFGIELRKRILGIVAATIFLIGFNFFRILATILIIAWFNLEAGDLAHGILFKVFLFFSIAGFYYYWFNWATKAKHV